MADEIIIDGLILEDAEDAELDAYDTVPTVDGDEDDALVEEDGGEQEDVPAEIINDNQADLDTNVNVKAGDRVAIMVVNGTPTVIGVMGGGDRMASDVDYAIEVAEEAAEAAGTGNQHFWDDANGAHVTDTEKDDWNAEYAKPDHGELDNPTDAHPWHNLLMNSLGMLLRTGLKNLVSITRSAVAFFDSAGNAAANITARFGPNGFQVGQTDKSHLVGDYHSLQLVDKDGNTYFHASDITGRNGEYTWEFEGDGTTTEFAVPIPFSSWQQGEDEVMVDGSAVAYTTSWLDDVQTYTLATAPASGASVVITIYPDLTETKAFTLGIRAAGSTVGPSSVAEGVNVTASEYGAHAEGVGTVASEYGAHAEGSNTTASGAHSHAEGDSTAASGNTAHAEGEGTTASAQDAHAEGQGTTASAMWTHAEGCASTASATGAHAEGQETEASNAFAHAEGGDTTASGAYSHAEGLHSTASGFASHAEGGGPTLASYGTTASGDYSHAQNLGTIAASQAQTALGRYNVEDTNDEYALIVGNGTDDSNRSNAFGVTWSGRAETKYARLLSTHNDGVAVNMYTNSNYIYWLCYNSDGKFFRQFRFGSLTTSTPGIAFQDYDPDTGQSIGGWEAMNYNTLVSRTANTVLAAPNGSNGAATFRRLVGEDIGMGSALINESLSTTSVASGTGTSLGSVTLTTGVWVVVGHARFATNATGYRAAKIHNTSGNVSNGIPLVRVLAASGEQTNIETMTILDVTAASSVQHLNVAQNSGSALNVVGYIRAFRLRD